MVFADYLGYDEVFVYAIADPRTGIRPEHPHQEMDGAAQVQPYLLVAIAGGTCAGKSTLATTLLGQLDDNACLINQDDFYPDRSSWAAEALVTVNWTSIDSIDLEELTACLRSLAVGSSAQVPVYDRATHSRVVMATREVTPASVVIFDGLHAIDVANYALASRERSRCKLLRVYIDCPTEERKRRRLEREAVMPIPGSFTDYWHDRSEPAFRAEIYPQLQRADLIVPSPWLVENIEKLLARINDATT